MTTTQKIIAIPAVAALILVGGAVAGYTGLASAQVSDATSSVAGMIGMRDRAPHVGGMITAINGTTIIVSDERRGATYTIEGANAAVRKDGAEATLSALAVGERIMAEGTLEGTTLTATKIMSGMGGPGMGGPGRHGKGPGVMGTVSAVNGSTITLTGPDGQSFTVEAGSATVQKMVAGSLGDIAVGDRIGVQGDVSGTTVTAKTIMDDLPEISSPAAQR